MRPFVCVGENIHCTRIYKTDGKFVTTTPTGYAIPYRRDGAVFQLPVPAVFLNGADWANGKVKHCAVAIWQCTYGDQAGRRAGEEYLSALAQAQEKAGATYLDINVDEFSTDVAERTRLVDFTVKLVQKASRLPVSIDSSNHDILRAGLSACDRSRGAPMLNSVSLERTAAIDLAAEFKAVVIASAAGECDLPASTAERLANLAKLVPQLNAKGIKGGAIHIDPLVFPISTDQGNGNAFLDAVSQVRKTYGPEVHIVAGLSNVSFGMPNRKLLNQVFAWLAIQAGADGGIVDPLQINAGIMEKLDTNSATFGLAKALLTGQDEFGMNYIAACRDGTIPAGA
ncbi:MAG: dihydropteroate synthase [bacterium]